MKKFLVAMGLVAFAVVGCDDSSSASAENSEPATLSSAEGQESSSSTKKLTDSSDSNCEECNDEAISSDSNAESNGSSRSSSSEQNVTSSSSEKLSETSSSSVDEVESSSGERDASQNSAEAKVMPSGTYDCTKYKCVTTEYLNQKYFEAGKYGEILDERDGQVYKTVQIEEQIWMAENLNYADSTKTPSLLKNSWCYDNDQKKCDVAGRLYTWAAAMDFVKTGCGYGSACSLTLPVQGICPLGWHLPSDAEWESLIVSVAGRYHSHAGTYLKSQRGWGYGNGTDAYGFSAIPASFWCDEYGFANDGCEAEFWSATEDVNGVSSMNLTCGHDSVEKFYSRLPMNIAFSIRCVKD
ncbi:fibrobacter succinogenes major paralogous domain-containing protein [Fibrobacter sp.]|uniref:fibrobacter succinogenes major paralogous domain-containing protein n=1 Tax=Fibrobacter sp. TaxID=35828 RepID=UPI0038706F75